MTPSRSGQGEADAVRVMNGLRRLVKVLSTSARAQTRARRVSGAQLFVLRQIAAHPGLTIGELAARTFSGQSTVSGVVARLVDQGLITRRPGEEDARQTVLTLTRKGERAVDGSEPVAQEKLAHALSEMPAGMRAALAEGLEVWLAAADVSDEPATMFFEDAQPKRKRTVVKNGRRS